MANSVLKNLVANLFHLITPQTHPGHGRCVVSWDINRVSQAWLEGGMALLEFRAYLIITTFHTELKLQVKVSYDMNSLAFTLHTTFD